MTIDAGAPAKINVANAFAPAADPTTTTTSTPRATNIDGTPAPTALPGPAPLPDDDGVPASIENGVPNGGDGNGDGIADAEQANVASLPSKYDVNGDGALNDYVTIESPAGTSIANARTMIVPADNPPPDGVALPAGLIDYDVHVIAPGDRADVKLFLPDGTQSAVYMLQNGQWTNFGNHSTIDDTANRVTLQLADGGAGDRSGTDGVIHDPVGVAQPGAASTVTIRNEVFPDGSAQSFGFTILDCGSNSNPGTCTATGNVPASPNNTVALADNSEHTFTVANPSNRWFRIGEAAVAGWSRVAVTCTGSAGGTNQQVDVANGFGFVRLNSSIGGACTFSNAENQSISVVNSTTPSGERSVLLHARALRVDQWRVHHRQRERAVEPARGDAEPVGHAGQHVDGREHQQPDQLRRVVPTARAVAPAELDPEQHQL